MEALHLSSRGLHKEDLIVGVGGSIFAHMLVFGMALLVPWAMPQKKLEMPYCTVNLVSMAELGTGAPLVRKGNPNKGPDAPKGQDAPKAAASSSSSSEKSGPLLSVKRLEVDRPASRPEPELKRIEAREAPKIPEKAPNVASVEKNLDKLITKPKAPPKPAPIEQHSTGAEERAEKRSSGQESASKQAPSASPSGGGEEQKGKKGGGGGGPQGAERGAAEGAAQGSPDGAHKGTGQGGGFGSPDGAAVASARRLYYSAIQNAIRRNWTLPEFLKSQKLEAQLVLVIRRDGKVLELQFEKRSGQPLFDQSIENAVRKAEPLPPFPEVYSPAKEEIGLRFRPEDLT